jgi:catechol 2,3-dioxygenase-like lactoylglutathione lyase family enzyme
MHTNARAVPVIPASDLERARRFYEERLGFELDTEGPDGYTFKVGDGYIFVYPTSANRGEATRVSFMVDDLDAEVRELKGKGIRFEKYDLPDTTWHEDNVAEYGGYRTFWFEDSEGNVLNVIEGRAWEQRMRRAA